MALPCVGTALCAAQAPLPSMKAVCVHADLCRRADSHGAPPAESGNEEVAAAAGRMLTSVIFSAASTQGGVIKTRWDTHDGKLVGQGSSGQA